MTDLSEDDLQWAFDAAFLHLGRHGYADIVWQLYNRADQARKVGERDRYAEELLFVAVKLCDDRW
jgi:hypothetical protein